MGFYNLVGSRSERQESLPGATSIFTEQYNGYFFTNNALYWSTSIALSTGTYGIYFSNLSDTSAGFSITHPTKAVSSKSLPVLSGTSFTQYIDGDAQNINISVDNSTPSWSTINMTFTSNAAINSIAYGNGTWVAGGTLGQVRSSTDGISWTTRLLGFTTNITTIEFGNNIFVLGTARGGIRTSTDAITWTARTGPSSISFSKIKYVNNIFLASYLGNAFARSTDGVTWTSSNILYTSGMFGMSYGAGVFVAVGGRAGGNSGIFRSSTNGITWTSRASLTGVTPRAVEFINNKFYAIGASSSGFIAESTNGITWTTTSTNHQVFTSSVSFMKYLENENIYIAGGLNEGAISSTNGTTWVESFAYTTTSNDIAYDNGNVIIVGNNYSIKTDLKNKATYLQISKIAEV